ncbi:hypothetical protein BDW69DRAFT_189757 [Aspergillus filifer]
MKYSFILGLLVNFLVVCPCLAAVSWKTVRCDEVSFNGKSMHEMWDNALLMAQTANTRINSITSGLVLPRTSGGRVADNAHFMFGINVSWGVKLGSAAKSTLSDVSAVYSNVEDLLGRDAGYLLCNGLGLQYGEIGAYATGVWYYAIPGTDDAIILRYTAGSGMINQVNPCEDGKTAGQTFRGQYLSSTVSGDQYTEILGILICTNQITPSRYKATLDLGFTVSGNKGVSDDYKSIAGTILHEMVHATNVDKYQDQFNVAFPDGYAAYGASRAMYLATHDQQAALVNPDNYRIFAEMSMSPKTAWQAPNNGLAIS